MSTETTDPTETEAFEQVCEELVSRILAGDLERDDVESAKMEVCSEYSAPKVPKNSELMDFVPNEMARGELEEVLQRKPVRTASGVSPIAIMTSPKRCPHGKCLYCPGGPDSEFSSSQSYTGHEPAAARAGSRTTTTLRPGDAAAQPVTTDRSPRRQGRVDPHGRDDDRPIARLPGVVSSGARWRR